MLDLLDDTLKLTLDRHYFGRTLLPNEIETETAYEFLCNSDGSLTKRTKLAPAAASTDPSNKAIAAGTKPDSQQLEEAINVQFPANLYPSKAIHDRLIAMQLKSHEAWNK